MILIIGGAGYIGSHVNKLLHQKGYETVVLDNLVFGHRDFVKWGKFIEGDMGDKELIANVLKKYPIDLVMHFGAFIDVAGSMLHPERYYRNNVLATVDLLDVMLDSKHLKKRNFVFSSTCAIYGIPQEIPITEEHPVNPINPYGDSKLMVEKILEDYHEAYDFNYVSLRYFNASGADPDTEIGEAHDPETHLIPLIFEAALKYRDDIKIFGTDYDTPDGTCVRDFIHVNDLAEAHILAYEKLLQQGKSNYFNLGNGIGHSVKEVIAKAKEVIGIDFKVTQAEKRRGDSPYLIGSSQKAKEVLDWQPKLYELDTIIDTAWKWHKKMRKA